MCDLVGIDAPRRADQVDKRGILQDSTPETRKLLLRNLLADRFKLVAQKIPGVSHRMCWQESAAQARRCLARPRRRREHLNDDACWN